MKNSKSTTAAQQREYKMVVKGNKLNAPRVWGEQLLKVI